MEDPDGVGGCLKSALDAAGVRWEHSEVNSVMGIPKPLAIAHLMASGGEPEDVARVDAIHRDFQARMIEHYRSDPSIREVDGAADVFRALRARGIKVALDTGFDRTIVDVLLTRLGWDENLLDATVTSDEVPQGRPHPDLIFRAMELTGVPDVTEVAKVGDTPSDLQEGTAAGCAMVIGVTEGTHSRELLLPHPHTHLVATVRDIPPLLS